MSEVSCCRCPSPDAAVTSILLESGTVPLCRECAAKMFKAYSHGERLHVYPPKDTHKHKLEGCYCGCNPKLEVQISRLLVIHNAYDGRA